jgi:hypothetical protein
MTTGTNVSVLRNSTREVFGVTLCDMVIPLYGEYRRVSKKLPHFYEFLSDNNCRFLVSIYPVRSPASFMNDWFDAKK